jgi:phage terminase small subunit
MDNLTDKQRLFIQNYLSNGFNATKAALEAGYSENTAKEIGYENLTKPHIRAAIDAEIDVLLANKKELTMQVIEELKLIAFSDIADYMDVESGEMKAELGNTRAIESIQHDTMHIPGTDVKELRKVKFKLHNKISGLDGLCRYLGINASGDVGSGLSELLKGLKEIK